MNRIPAAVAKIDEYGGISIVYFEAYGQKMQMMALEIDKSIKRGSQVILGAKASDIALGREPIGDISISNRLGVTVESVAEGKLLSSVKLILGESILESIITLDSSKSLSVKRGDKLTALINPSKLSILETIQ